MAFYRYPIVALTTIGFIIAMITGTATSAHAADVVFGRFVGTIQTSDGGPRDPLSDVRVIFWGMTEANGHWSGTGGGQQAELSADGNFTAQVAAGHYRICIDDPQHRYKAQCLGGGTDGYPDTYHRFTISGGQQINGLSMTIEQYLPHGDISGTITEVDGDPLFPWLDGQGNMTNRGSVYAVNAGGTYRADPAADGTYTLRHLPAGDYKLKFDTFWGQYQQGWLGANGQFTSDAGHARSVSVNGDQVAASVDGAVREAVFLAGHVSVPPGAPTPPSGGDSTRLGCVVPFVTNLDTGELVAFRSNVRDDSHLRGYWSIALRDANYENTPLERGNYEVTFRDVSDSFPGSCGQRYYQDQTWRNYEGKSTINGSGIKSDLNLTLAGLPATTSPTTPNPTQSQPAEVPPHEAPSPPAAMPSQPAPDKAIPTVPGQQVSAGKHKTCRTFTASYRGQRAAVRHCTRAWTQKLEARQQKRAKRLAKQRFASHSAAGRDRSN